MASLKQAFTSDLKDQVVSERVWELIDEEQRQSTIESHLVPTPEVEDITDIHVMEPVSPEVDIKPDIHALQNPPPPVNHQTHHPESKSSTPLTSSNSLPRTKPVAKSKAPPRKRPVADIMIDQALSVDDDMDMLLGGPPKKRQRKKSLKAAAAVAEDDESTSVSSNKIRSTSSIPGTSTPRDTEAVDLLDELVDENTMIWDSGAGHGEKPDTTVVDDLDVEEELLKAVGMDSGAPKRPRSADGDSRARKRTKNPWTMPTPIVFEGEDELALAAMSLGQKKKLTKAQKREEASYHVSQPGAKGGRSNVPKAPRPSTSQRPPKQRSARASVPATVEDTASTNGHVSEVDRAPSQSPAVGPTTLTRHPRPRIPPKTTPVETEKGVDVEGMRQRARPTTRDTQGGRRSPSPDPIALGLAMDDEELFFLKAGLARRRGENIIPRPRTPPPEEPPHRNTQLRVHRTGAARTEGYYKIPEALKSAYLPQRNRAAVLDQPNAARVNVDTSTAVGASASSRSNRVNARRLVQGMEQTNKAMGDNNTATQLQFNQLRARKKQLIFARSPIHDWGLYAMEAIPQGEMVIEYVGEVIRAQVADKREKWYERIGIGSSYLFRVDEDLVVDATKKGNLGSVPSPFLFSYDSFTDGGDRRLINHCCTPNCNARIIVVNSQKKIVIYAKSNIEPGEEITYGTFHRHTFPGICRILTSLTCSFRLSFPS